MSAVGREDVDESGAGTALDGRGPVSPEGAVDSGVSASDGNAPRGGGPGRIRAVRWLAGAVVVAAVAASAVVVLARGGSSGDAGASVPVTGERMVGLLRGLLPPGQASPQAGGTGTARPGQGVPPARLVFDDGHGAAALEVDVGRLPLPVPDVASGCPDRAHFPYDQCSSRRVNGGATLVVDQGFADPLAPGGVKRWLAILTTKDGRQVAVAESNASSPQAVTASRPAPPLTTGQLAAIATSRVWAPVLAALPTPPDILPPPGVPQMTGRRILTVLDGALPPALHLSDQRGWEGYANLTADDGGGKGLITVTVQRWKHDDSYLAPLFKGAVRLPDSTVVKTRQTTPAAHGGGVEWDADVLRPDGLRVLVTELNAPAFGPPATRQDPPLTLRQLTSLALDPGWQ